MSNSFVISELVARFAVEDQASSSLQLITKNFEEVGESAGSSLQEATNHAKGFGAGLEDQIPKTTSFSEKVGNMANSFVHVGHAIDEVDNMFDRYELTEMSVENAQLRLEKAQEAYTLALKEHGEGSKEAEAAERNLEIATNRNEAANIRAKSSMVMIGLSAVALVGQYTSVAESALKFAASGTVIATASATITGAFAAISGAITSLSVFLLANPVVLVLAAIAAAAIALKYAWDTNWGDIQGKTRSAVDIITAKIKEIPYAYETLKSANQIISDNAENLRSLAFGPLGYAYNAYIRFSSGVDGNTTAVQENTKGLEENQTALDKTLSLLSNADNILYTYYKTEEKVNVLTKQLADMLKEEKMATDDYNNAVKKLNDDETKRNEIEQKLQVLVEKGKTDLPIYSELISQHDQVTKDIEVDKQALNAAEEKYAQYRDKSIKDSPEYKAKLLELEQAEKELALAKDKTNASMEKSPEAFGLADSAITNTKVVLETAGIPGWDNYNKAFSTATANIQEPGWSIKINENIGTVSTAQAESIPKTESWYTQTKKYFSDTATDISTSMGNIWTSIKGTWDQIWNYLFGASIIPDIYNAFVSWFDKIATYISSTWIAIKNAVPSAWSGIQVALESAWNSIKSSGESIWNSIQDIFAHVGLSESSVKSAWDDVKSWLTDVWDGFISAAKSAWETVKSYWAKISSSGSSSGGGSSGNPYANMSTVKLNRSGGRDPLYLYPDLEHSGYYVQGSKATSHYDPSTETFRSASHSLASGGSFWASRPTSITVGDAGSGNPEYVSVTPLRKMGAGAESMIVNVNISGNIYGVNDIRQVMYDVLKEVNRNVRALGG